MPVSSQLVKKFPAFCGARRFITAFTSAHHLSVFWATSIHSMPWHLSSWRSILILLSPLCLGLPNGLYPSGFSTKTLYTPFLSPIHATCPTHLKWVQAWRDTGVGGSIILKLCWSQGVWRCGIDLFGMVTTLQITLLAGNVLMSSWVVAFTSQEVPFLSRQFSNSCRQYMLNVWCVPACCSCLCLIPFQTWWWNWVVLSFEV
jgi:hypothetical protein